MTLSRTGRADLSAVMGAVALLVGAFAPLARVSLFGDVSYFDAFEAPGTVLVLAAAATLLAVFRGKAVWLRALAPTAWLALLWPVLGQLLTPRDESLLGQLHDSVQQQLGRTVGDALLDVSELSWGPWVLLAGCVLLTSAALRTRSSRRARG